MLTELCQELRNWFNRNMDKWDGDFVIEDGVLRNFAGKLKPNQYFRIMGSVFNDGVHKYGEGGLTDETFTGSIWAMAVPPAVIALSEDIDAWKARYGGEDSVVRSPFNSESWGGYSYSKTGSGSGSGSDGSKIGSWKAAFAYDLNRWRKI